MAQMNHNVNYLTSIDGITVWERLRVIRNFIQDRTLALAMAEMQEEKNDEKLEDSALDKYERREIELYRPQSIQLIKDAKAEIEFLVKLEKELTVRAEETRIEGKSDEEMYEINYFEELVQINLLQVQSEMMAHGHISAETMKILIKNPFAMNRVIELGFLAKEAGDVAKISNASQISQIGYTK